MKPIVFRDGDRLVIVLKGADKEEEERVTRLLSSAAGGIETMKPVDAVPVQDAADDDEAPAIPVFSDGPYIGLTPDEALEQGGNKAFIYLSKTAAAQEEGRLASDIREAVKRYLKRFRNADTERYAGKLTDAQIDRFFEVFRYVLPADMAERQDDRRALVKEALECIQHMFP